MASFADNREEWIAEREQALSSARAAHREEREKLAADRAECDRLLSESRAANREASRTRDRARRLGARFVQRMKHEHATACRQLDQREAKLAADRERFGAEQAHFEKLRSEFHVSAAAARDRLRDAWAAVKAQQKRAAEEWAEANHHFSEQTATLDVRAAEVVRLEKALSDNRARIEAETAGLREEATALELRIENARASLAELELRRDHARAELLNTELPGALAIEPTNLDDLARREQVLAGERAAVAAIKLSLDREAADVNDRRRMLAEQFALLADARARWQRAERQTVIEMEELARDLGRRERNLDGREQRLIRADGRRREEGYELWQLRLRLESWQTKLTAFEMGWHTQREQLEADLDRRVTAVNHRETQVEEAFGRWEKARASERERLRGELELWAADRERLDKAVADVDRQRHEMLDELTRCASRALAAEQLVTGEGKGGSDRMVRRLAVLRKRWERTFDRKAKKIEHERAQLSAERATIDERYRALQTLLTEVIEREATLSNRQAAADIAEEKQENVGRRKGSDSPSTELVALRNEVERMAGVLLEVKLPDPPTDELLWAFDEQTEPGTSDVLPFASGRAA